MTAAEHAIVIAAWLLLALGAYLVGYNAGGFQADAEATATDCGPAISAALAQAASAHRSDLELWDAKLQFAQAESERLQAAIVHDTNFYERGLQSARADAAQCDVLTANR